MWQTAQRLPHVQPRVDAPERFGVVDLGQRQAVQPRPDDGLQIRVQGCVRIRLADTDEPEHVAVPRLRGQCAQRGTRLADAVLMDGVLKIEDDAMCPRAERLLEALRPVARDEEPRPQGAMFEGR